jgi:hypothetical protein
MLKKLIVDKGVDDEVLRVRLECRALRLGVYKVEKR